VGILVGGALGNALDRLTGGSVVDFLDVVPWWPAFNFADVAITTGSLALALSFASGRKGTTSANAPLPNGPIGGVPG
jgi:signal peptidase II